jgi:CRP-like cAMP-binding protein
VLLHLPIAEFEAIAAEDPQAWRWLAVLPIQQTVLATGVAEDLMIRDPRRRLLATLLRLAALRGPFAGTEPQDVMVSQEDLASIVNLSRTAVGLMLRALEAEGLVGRRYSRIRIADPAAASRLAAAPPRP